VAAIADCILSKRRIVVEAVRIEDRANITERMSRDGGDLRLGALHEREPRLRPKKLRLGTLMPYGFARLRLQWPILPGLGHISIYRMDPATRGR